MQFSKIDGGFIDYKSKVEDFEIPLKLDLSLEELFLQFNNRIVITKNWDKYIIKEGKFCYPDNGEAFKNYIKVNPRYSRIVKLDQNYFDIKTMQFSKIDGGFIDYKSKVEDFEISKEEQLSYDELFVTFNNRIVLSRNWEKFIIKDGKFY